MPSKIHQILIDLIGRKMWEKGYLPVAFDGKEYVINEEKINLPPKIGKHRPDIIGINLKNNNICIGEAKTIEDLSSKRTIEQFLDYSNIISRTSNQKYELIIGIPMRAELKLRKILRIIGIDRENNVSFIFLPEELAGDDS